MVKFYTAEKEINGTKYICQFNGLSAALKAVDDSYIEGSNNTSVEKMAKYLLEHVVVSPKMTIDDFEDMNEFNEVIAFAREVMQGNFRNQKDEEPAKAKGSK